VTLANLLTLETRLSAERLGPYRAAVGGDLAKAVALYEWNRTMSAAFGATLADLEVIVRNSMHDQLTAWSTRTHGKPRWYLDPAKLLNDEATKDIAKARQRATINGRPETAGRVVAELSLGFWRYLLASRYERTLWLPALRPAFPHFKGIRRHLEQQIRPLHLLRNRVAHHEPIHGRPLASLHASTLQVIGWVCPVAHDWIRDGCQVRQVLAQKP